MLGRERGDILFPEDGYVSGSTRASRCATVACTSRIRLSNGTFVRVRGERAVPRARSC